MNLQELRRKWESVWVAITFAEAGEVETAREFLKEAAEKDGRKERDERHGLFVGKARLVREEK